MRHILKPLLLLVLLANANRLNAQLIEKKILSKMDIDPQYELWDGTTTRLMGFTKLLGEPINLPSPTLIFTEGDSVVIEMRNWSQSAPHTIHLHGLDVDQANDGVPHLSFEIEHDSTGFYRFTAPHAGTYLYHCHVISTIHVQAGMYGMIIVKPQGNPNSTWNGGYDFDKEYAWMMSELDSNWHQDSIIHHSHNPMAMQVEIPDYKPQYFLINGKSEQQLAESGIEISAQANETIYLRLVNIGYYGNKVVFPSGLNAKIVASDGRSLPQAINSDTLELFPGERYGVLLKSTNAFTGQDIKVSYFNLNTQLIENTQAVNVHVEGFFGLDDISSNPWAQISPNPTKQSVIIRLTEHAPFVTGINVYDATGRLVFQTSEQLPKQGQPKAIDMSSWENGIFFIQLVTPQKQYIEKVLLQK